MRKWLGMMLLLAATALGAQPAPPTVTLTVTDKPIAEVAAEIGKQAGVQVGILEPGEAKVTLTLEKASADDAVAALTKAFEGSWARFYLLETAPPATPYAPEALLTGLQYQYENWVDSLSEEKRKEVFAKALASRQATPEGQAAPLVPPGAGSYAKKPGDAEAGREAPAQPGILYDPVRVLTIPNRQEKVTLELAETPLPQALYQFTTACGFLVAPSYELTGGSLALKLQDTPLPQALDEVAAQVEGKWRVLYLVSKPRPLSDADADKLFERFFQGRWSKFWAEPKEERSKKVQDAVRMIGQWKTAASVPAAPGKTNMAAEALQRFGPMILSKVNEYSTTLGRTQRDEIKPALQALARAVSGQ